MGHLSPREEKSFKEGEIALWKGEFKLRGADLRGPTMGGVGVVKTERASVNNDYALCLRRTWTEEKQL